MSAPDLGAPTPRADARPGFNLSAAAIRHQQLTLFFIIAIAIAGVAAYFQLAQREDPDFTFRALTVRTLWPGATPAQVDEQVTGRIEKKLQEIPHFKRTQSYSKAGESLIALELKDAAPRRAAAVLPGAQEARRNRPHAAGRGHRTVLQRRVRRRLRLDLRVHRRRLHAVRAA